MKTTEQERAEWVAKLAIAYTRHMTDAARLELLAAFYDVAYATGRVAGSTDVATAVRETFAKAANA